MRLALAIGSTLTLAALVVAPDARALTQPNGAAIPSAMGCNAGQPTGLLPVFACACMQSGVCNIGAPCPSSTSCDDGQHGTCESTMWHSFNDNTCIPSNHSGLDPWTQGQVMPETFHPTCGLTYTVLSRGTARFENAFGWYNATTGSPSQAPAASDLHVMLDCHAAAGTQVTLDLTKEPAWKGGDVGFFLLTPEDHAAAGTCAGGDCCATVARLQSGTGYAYYSQRELNPDGQGANPFIHLLTFASGLSAQKYYFGWEDTFHTTSADFTDLVTSVSGVDCSGAGQACNTGQLGVCAMGVTQCSGGATPMCTPTQKPMPEQCNGVDDNCDGMVDNGATCPTAGDVCDNGSCVPHCGAIEYPCAGNAQCDPASGLCVEAACVGVTCAAGLVCEGGKCTTPCTGVVCPHGQTCVGDACVDLCAKVTCPAGQVCAEGTCVAACGSCGGLTCGAPLSCDATSGSCADTSCAKPCAAGTYCQGGTCVDDCAGTTCPKGLVCSAGQCQPPKVDGGLIAPDAGAGKAGGGGPAGTGATDADGGAGGAGASASGCGCRLGDGGAEAVPLGLGLALLVAGARRRARRVT